MPTAATRILQEELEFFERQRLELLTRAPGKYALVKGSTLIGIFDSEVEAAGAGYPQLGNEPFLIKHIVEADVPLITAALRTDSPIVLSRAASIANFN